MKEITDEVRASARTKIAKAKTALILNHPFFAAVIMKTPAKEDLNHATAYVDGRKMGYNPQFIDDMNQSEVIGVHAHEVLHICNAHHARRGARNPRKWNRACDYAINPILVDCGFALPDDCLLDNQYRDMSAEAIYAKLPDDPSDGDGDGSDDDPGRCGGIKPLQGADGGKPTAAERDEAIQEANVTTWQAMQAAKSAGKLPGSIAKEFADLFQPSINWREVLREFIERVTRNDYSMQRPNRRYVANGIYLPSLYSQGCGPIVFAADASGSVSDKLFQMIGSELAGILATVQPEYVQWLCWEMRITDDRRIEPHELPLEVTRAGYGGTDAQCVFDWIAADGIEPQCVIIGTDLYFSEPDPRGLDCPVLWIAPRDEHRDPPSFGQLLEMPPEAEL